MQYQSRLNLYLKQAIRDNWDRDALSDFKGETFRFGDVAEKIATLHLLFEQAGIQRGDKIALCGRDTSRWAIAALAVLTYGAVAVPIFQDFTPDTIHHLINHSESRLLFADRRILDSLSNESMPGLEGIILINDYSLSMSRNDGLTKGAEHLDELFRQRYPQFSRDDVHFVDTPPDEVVLINYTSGSTGFSKGVMLTERNLWSNIQYSIDGLSFLLPGDKMISMLPLAHMFGFMFETVHPFVKGCHVYFLARKPSPRILMEAFAEIRPKLIITVPLVIEKIIRSRVFPMLQQPKMKVLTHIPLVNSLIYRKIRKSIIGAFGGNLQELIIGGAGLNNEVETFLRKIKFPFTVGYGMTECGPIVAYCPWDKQREGSCGRCVDRMRLRIDSDDPSKVPGVLWVKGDNVMKGYYKNPEATQAVFRDGWMNTGDICTLDKDGYLYIKGRDKNMILGPSGQNIYPEEIEQQLNYMPLVMESIVIDSGGGKLKALIHPDFDAAEKEHMTRQQVYDRMEENVAELNKTLPSYSKIASIQIYDEEFEKTPKRSIKRYLYMK